MLQLLQVGSSAQKYPVVYPQEPVRGGNEDRAASDTSDKNLQNEIAHRAGRNNPHLLSRVREAQRELTAFPPSETHGTSLRSSHLP